MNFFFITRILIVFEILILGTYQFSQRRGYTTNSTGEVNVPMSMASSTVGGLLGQYMSSPFYLVKAHMELEKQENKSEKNSYSQIAARIYRDHGVSNKVLEEFEIDGKIFIIFDIFSFVDFSKALLLLYRGLLLEHHS